MTATLSTAPEAEQPELDPLRLLPITANLLPPEITDARRTRKVRRVAAAIVAGALVLTAVWYFVAKQQTSHAQSSLDQAEQQSVSLTHKEASYANLVKVQADAAAINSKLERTDGQRFAVVAVASRTQRGRPGWRDADVGVRHPGHGRRGISYARTRHHRPGSSRQSHDLRNGTGQELDSRLP